MVVVPHYTKAKHGAIVDRLHHHRRNALRQANPLVAPGIAREAPPGQEDDALSEFWDTYDAVCNAGVLPRLCAPAASPGAGRGAAAGIPSELQRLCIVLRMRESHRAHLDFVYSPRHGELDPLRTVSFIVASLLH